MQILLRGFASILVLFAISCGSSEGELGTLCTTASAVLGDSSIQPADRPSELERRFLATSPSTPLRNSITALSNAAPSQRYSMMEHTARTELGASGWSCPDLERLWNEAAPAPSAVSPGQ